MNLSNDIFEKFFMNKISQEELLSKMECNSPRFEITLKDELEKTIVNKNGIRLEYLIYTIFLTEENININLYVDLLNELIICKWHEQHENIAMLLQKIHSPSSVIYLKKAIYMHPQYLEWDDNYAFEVKCIWALGNIKNFEAKEVLDQVSRDTNIILSQNAKIQLGEFAHMTI